MMTRSQKLRKTTDNFSTDPKILQTTCIQQVNDDCLRNIFEFLPIKDLCMIERVCKRWQAVSKDSWQNVKKLNIDSVWGLNVNWLSTPKKSKMLEQVLQRCGRFLVEIDLLEFSLDDNNSILSCIAELCPNLQSIHTGYVKLFNSAAKSIALNCTNLISITVGDCRCNDASLSNIFRRNQNLKHIDFWEVRPGLRGKCLLDLPKSIETINFDCCSKLSSQHIASALKGFKMIRLLSIGSDWLEEVDTVAISTVLPNTIRELQMLEYNERVHEFIMMQFNLKALEISSTDLTDEFLLTLTKNCRNITELNLYNCTRITDDGIKLLTQLSNITILGVAFTNITNRALTHMQNLRKLDCTGCRGINDGGILTLIESSNTIEEIILFDTFVSNRLISGAIEILFSRPDQILMMDVRSTSMFKHEFEYSMPHNLFVTFDDLFEMSLSSENDDCDS